jgi:hypothetical protein
MKHMYFVAIMLSGLTGCGHATMATQGAGVYSQSCSPYAAQAAFNPAYGHNEGPFGALAKTLAGIDGGSCGGNLQLSAPPYQPIVNPPVINRSITCFDLGSGIVSCS